MKYIKKDQGSYNLHIIKTNLYKTITIKVFFREKVLKENITKRNFLSRIMMLSTNDYQNKVELAKALQNLYAANIEIRNRRIGNYLDMSISLKVLNDKYTEEGNFKKSLELLSSVIFNPKVNNNAFCDEEFETIYEEYKADLKSIEDNKASYAFTRALEETNKNLPSSYRTLGYLEDLEKLSKEDLYKYYKEIINHNYVDIFVLGDVDEKEITNLLKETFKVNTYKKQPIEARVEENKITRSKKVIENLNTEQDNLIITLSTNNLTAYERNYPLTIFNVILGGGTDSILFDEIREKRSLAYSISSVANKLDNLIAIRGGITSGKSIEVTNIVKKILKKLASGKFDDDAIKKAKEFYTSALDDIIESPFQIIESYYMMELLGVDDIETKRKKIEKVTKEEIIEVANKIRMNTIYILEGSEKNGKN